MPFQAPAQTGSYSLGLQVPDPDSDSTTADLTKPAYSVRLANDVIWDSETGVNDLGMQLTVE